MKALQIGILAALTGAAAFTLEAQTYLWTDHTDVGVNYAGGAWDLHVHAEALGQEFEPGAAVLGVDIVAAQGSVPSGPAWSFLGAAGNPVWILPQIENPSLVFLGLGTEEMASGLFTGNQVTLALRNVNGPGAFALYETGPIGDPMVFMSSGDGIGAGDAITLTAGGHRHVNWAFTAPGVYRIDFEASGTLADGNGFTSSGSVTYTFAVAARPGSGRCFHFTQEHVDVLSVTWDGASQQLSLLAVDDAREESYASNECVVVCPESTKRELPAGTPLGNEGDLLWILPQGPEDGVPYVGVSAEDVAPGQFNPFTIRLTRLEGPGQFLLWQAGFGGVIDVKMDTRDGIGAGDALTIAPQDHAHYNWGFTTSGVYRAYFQVSGVRVGQTTNNLSPETPLTFHVQPLRPFENWTATNWPCECAAVIIAEGADPDADGLENLLEYGFGNDPKVALYTNTPALTFVSDQGGTYGALRYVQATNATDLRFEVRASGAVGALTETLTNTSSRVLTGQAETVTVRDSAPREQTTSRFYQLRLQLE